MVARIRTYMKIRIPISLGSAGLERTAVLLSFIIPALIRWIPEAQFPYPIGFDTPLYISWGRRYASNPVVFPLMWPLLGGLYALGLDTVIVMKYLPTLLYGLLGFSMYRFSRFYLGWRLAKCLLTVLLVTLSFASLRVSWDMHKQLMATAFLFLALSWLKSLNERPLGFVAFAVSSFLAAFSHQVLFGVLMVVLLYWFLFKAREEPKKGLPILVVVTVILFLFVGAWYGWRLDEILRNALGRWLWDVSSLGDRWLWEAESNGSVFLLLHGLMVHLVVLGLFKDRVLLPWLGLGLLGSFSTVLFPLHVPGESPSRWMLLLAYPFSFYVANGFDKLRLLKMAGSKMLVALILTLLVINIPTWGFLGLTHQPSQFSRVGLLPETMVSSSIPAHDIEATIWLVKRFDEAEGTLLIVHGHYFGWALYYTGKKVMTFGELYGGWRTIGDALELAQKENAGDIYLLWYVDGDAYSSGFIKVAEKGSMKLYKYVEGQPQSAMVEAVEA